MYSCFLPTFTTANFVFFVNVNTVEGNFILFFIGKEKIRNKKQTHILRCTSEENKKAKSKRSR
jgi:hypothetical protein